MTNSQPVAVSADEKVADPEVKRVVEALATGFSIRVEDLGGYDGYDVWVEKREGFRLTVPLERLTALGVIERHPTHAHGYRLTDKWHRAYMRSTDELGDGRLYVPE